ncbi:MAG: CHAT domain-containing protein [Ginsengibacter sp.]
MHYHLIGNAIMVLRIFLLAVCLTITFIPQSQNNDRVNDYTRLYKTAEKLYNSETPTNSSDSLAFLNYSKVISILKENNKNDPVLFDCYLKSGIISMSKKEDQRALNFFFKSIALKNKSPFIPDSLLFKSYLFTGNEYHNLFNMDSASYYYNQAEYLINKYPAISEAERLYNQAGVLYYETGEYKKSITYFKKALSIVEQQVPLNKYFVVNYENNIASAFKKSGDFEQALTLYKSLLPYNINKNELLHNIGATFLEAGNYKEAISWLKKVQYNNQSKYNDVGKAYMLLHNTDSALHYFNSSLQFQNDLHSTQKNPEYAYTLKYLGDILVEKNLPAQALKNYQQAIIQADPDFNDTNIINNPQSFYGLHQTFFLFDALVAKAGAFQLQSTQKTDYVLLKQSFETYSSALQLARHVERMYNSDESRLFLKKSVDPVYKAEVETGLQLYEALKDTAYLLKVLKYIEDDKASVLQADLHELELSSIDGLPKDLLQEEKRLKAVISGLNNRVSQNKDTALNNELLSGIQDDEIQLSTIQAKLNDDPAYYKLKFNPPGIDIKTIREQQLQKDEAIISYYYTTKRLLCFYITKERLGYVSEPLQTAMSQKIFTLRDELGLQDKGDKKAINEICAWLYTYLIRPVIQNLEKKKHLVVIPYNEISYIPFETLIDPANNELLLNNFAISYNYSVNFLQRYKAGQDIYKVLAFAPFTNSTPGSKTYPILKASLDEVAGLTGKVLLSEQATKSNFLKLESQYPIIHLATHAIVDNVNPLKSFIAFYPLSGDSTQEYNLYESEIYNLDMAHNQLVILSACETGNGQMINGEGIISLSRAFFYAGSKSVMTSLWKAEDISVTFITKHMHEYLRKGYAKDEALQLAKTDYLENNDIDPRFKTPAFWAPLVLTGDFNPVVINHGDRSYVMILLIAIIASLILFILIKKRPGILKFPIK